MLFAAIVKRACGYRGAPIAVSQPLYAGRFASSGSCANEGRPAVARDAGRRRRRAQLRGTHQCCHPGGANHQSLPRLLPLCASRKTRPRPLQSHSISPIVWLGAPKLLLHFSETEGGSSCQRCRPAGI